MAHMYTLEEALDIIINGQYGRDVRQAIYDGIYRTFEEGHAGSTDLVAREGIDNLTLATESALAEMNLHCGRTQLVDGQTVATASSAIILPKAMSDFDSLWIRVTGITGTAEARLKIGSYIVSVPLPKWNDDEPSNVDIMIDAITKTSAIVKMVGNQGEVKVAGGSTITQKFYADEFPLQAKDDNGVSLNMSVRNFTVTNCAGATVSVVGYGNKGSNAGTSDGLVLDENGIIHFV